MPARVGQRLTNIRDFLLLAPLPHGVVLLLPSAVSLLFFEVLWGRQDPDPRPAEWIWPRQQRCETQRVAPVVVQRSLSLGLPFALLLSAGPFPEMGAAGEERAVAAFALVTWLEKPGLVTAGVDDNCVNAVPSSPLPLASHCVAALPHFLAWRNLLLS